MKTKITFTLAFFCHVFFLYAQYGMLDATFDGDGKKVISFATPNDYGEFVLIQADSKIIVGGRSSLTGGNLSFSLARLNPDGSFDNTFGTQGMVTTSYGTDGFEALSGALQTDGKILVVGNAFTNINLGYSQVAIVRYNSDGSLDATFDSDGMVFTQITDSNEDFVKRVRVQPDGKIVVGVQSRINFDREFVLTRYNANGALDVEFGTNGIVRTILPNTNEAIYDLALQDDGKILAVGTISGSSNDDLAVFRYNTDGSMDTSFASNGMFTYDFANAHNYVFGVGLTSDSKIILVGRYQNGAISSPFVCKLNANGTFDDSFATNGMLIQTTDEMPNDVIIQEDDRILVVGTSNSNFGIWKLNSNGTFDTTFGLNGKVETTVTSTYAIGNRGALQPDGKLVVVGSVYGNPFMKYGVVRYTNDNPLLVNEFENAQIAIFPNPTNGILNINSAQKINRIEVYDLLGKLLSIQKSSSNTIDLTAFISGVYCSRIYLDNGAVETVRVIKE